MDKCRTCGQALTQQANFCGSCGVQNGQLPEGYDQASSVKLYAEKVNSLLSAYPEQDHTQMMGRLRDKLRISDTTHQVIWKKLSEAFIALRPLTTFRLEFNERVPDAFAGHDTYLEFSVHNDSTSEFLSFQLFWDDRETPGEQKFIAQTPHPLQGGISAIVGGSHVFHRPGVKSIDTLELTVTNVLNDSAKFRVAPFRVKVGSASQIVSSTVTNHTQISIEGRGVIDASGLGSEAIGPNTKEPHWLELKCSPVLEVVELAWRAAVDLAKHLDDLLAQKTLEEKRRLEAEEATRREIEEKSRQKALAIARQEADEKARMEAEEKARRDIEEKARQEALEVARREAEVVGRQEAEEKALLEAEKKARRDIEEKARREADDKARQEALELLRLGESYFDDVNFREAVNYFTKSANAGNITAKYYLGMCYQYGFGVEISLRHAANWEQQARSKCEVNDQPIRDYEKHICQLDDLSYVRTAFNEPFFSFPHGFSIDNQRTTFHLCRPEDMAWADLWVHDKSKNTEYMHLLSPSAHNQNGADCEKPICQIHQKKIADIFYPSLVFTSRYVYILCSNWNDVKRIPYSNFLSAKCSADNLIFNNYSYVADLKESCFNLNIIRFIVGAFTSDTFRREEEKELANMGKWQRLLLVAGMLERHWCSIARQSLQEICNEANRHFRDASSANKDIIILRHDGTDVPGGKYAFGVKGIYYIEEESSFFKKRDPVFVAYNDIEIVCKNGTEVAVQRNTGKLIKYSKSCGFNLINKQDTKSSSPPPSDQYVVISLLKALLY
jgi:hypothetical protein